MTYYFSTFYKTRDCFSVILIINEAQKALRMQLFRASFTLAAL